MERILEGLKEVKRKINDFHNDQEIVFYYHNSDNILMVRALIVFGKYTGFLSEWKFLDSDGDLDFVNDKLFALICRDVDREKWYKNEVFNNEWTEL
jgi:hypothetical protein